MMSRILFFGTCLGVLLISGGLSVSAQTQAPPAKKLPKVLVLGDQVYDSLAERLKGKAVVMSGELEGNSSDELLASLEAWLSREKPDVVHFSLGLEQDVGVLRHIATRIQQETTVAWVYANHPLQPDQHDAEVARHNLTAREVMTAAGVPVHDLQGLVELHGADQQRQSEAVADCVLRQWSVWHHSTPSPARASGPEAAAKYREAEAAHDAEVPEAYKHLPIGQFSLPGSAEAWQQQRPEVLRVVKDSLGDLPPRPAKTTARVVSRELRRGYLLERVAINNGEGNDISALVLVPEKRQVPAPAILWLHSSTPDKNALITPGSDPESIGEAFVRLGYVVVAPDAWYYGDRKENVPSGPRDVYHRGVPPHANITQDALLKLNLWLGRTLWGMMVRDDQIALDYLSQRPEVDAQRIGATGMSMGSTRAWWLAAVDERVAATVGVACLTRYENLIRHGNLKAHGLYYFTYGLLKHFDTEGVLALMAPRPFLALTGDIDYGSPVDGIRVLEEKVSQVYGAVGAPERFKSIVYPDTGHVYTPTMRTEMLEWFERWLKSKP